MNGMTLRRVGSDSANLLDRVAPDVFDDDIVQARLATYLAQPTNLLVVALKAGEVVGQAAAVIHHHPDRPTELYIDNLGVTPDLKRQGIATATLDELVAWGGELGCEEIWVATEPDNFPARALYQGRGSEAETFAMYVYEY